jgi:hypothetical protein
MNPGLSAQKESGIVPWQPEQKQERPQAGKEKDHDRKNQKLY